MITGKVDQINAQKMYRTELVVDGVNIFRDKGAAQYPSLPGVFVG